MLSRPWATNAAVCAADAANAVEFVNATLPTLYGVCRHGRRCRHRCPSAAKFLGVTSTVLRLCACRPASAKTRLPTPIRGEVFGRSGRHFRGYVPAAPGHFFTAQPTSRCMAHSTTQPTTQRNSDVQGISDLLTTQQATQTTTQTTTQITSHFL